MFIILYTYMHTHTHTYIDVYPCIWCIYINGYIWVYYIYINRWYFCVCVCVYKWMDIHLYDYTSLQSSNIKLYLYSGDGMILHISTRVTTTLSLQCLSWWPPFHHPYMSVFPHSVFHHILDWSIMTVSD